MESIGTNPPTFTDAQIEELLIKHNGQPTKVASELGVTYVQVWRRIRANPSLYEVQKSNRQKTFQDLNNFQVTAVLAGIMKSPEFDEDGNIKKDENGRTVYMDAVVGVNARMEYASRLMTLFKSDEGIMDEVNLNMKTVIDPSKLSDDTLDDLEKMLKGDEK